jgi:hypothetical protein
MQKRRLIQHSSSSLFAVYDQMLSSLLPVQYAKRRLILHSSSTLFGVYDQMLSSLLPVQWAKKKASHTLLFDSLCRLNPDVVFSFTSAKYKKKTCPALLFDSLWRLCPDVVFSSIGASLSF